MNNDRFKYRVWSPNVRKYYPKDSHIAIPQSGKPIIYTFFENDCDEPPIIEQCTGFKDKNGKLIFEGDVLDGLFFVGWSKFHGALMTFPCNDEGYYEYLNGAVCGGMEITGTIHDKEDER